MMSPVYQTTPYGDTSPVAFVAYYIHHGNQATDKIPLLVEDGYTPSCTSMSTRK